MSRSRYCAGCRGTRLVARRGAVLLRAHRQAHDRDRPTDAGLLAGAAKPFNQYARGLDAHLNGRTCLACDRLAIADFAAASRARDWREAGLAMDGFPNILRWLDELMAIPAWAEPWPQHCGSGLRG